MRAAGCTLAISYALSAQGRLDQALEQAELSLRELRAGGYLDETESAVVQLAFLARNQPSRLEAVGELVDALLSEMPPGLARDRIGLERATMLSSHRQEKEARALLEGMLSDPALTDEARAPVLGALVTAARADNRYEDALLLIERALPQAPLNPPVALYSGSSRGELLFERGVIRQAQHRWPEALAAYRESAEAFADPRWVVWKATVQGKAVAAALRTYDMETARDLLSQGMETAAQGNFGDEGPSAAISLLAALTSGVSESGQLAPASGWLGGHDPLVGALLREAYASDEKLSRLLSGLDSWTERLRQRGDTYTLASALYWKHALLEASGRIPEARQTAQDAIAMADRARLPLIQLVGRLSLAGLENQAHRKGAAEEILDDLDRIGPDLSPHMARFAPLVHAHFLLESNRPEAALAYYGRSIEAGPEKAAPAYYGRARAYLALGRPERALEDLAQVERLVVPEPYTLALLQAARGRAAASMGRTEEAIALFRAALPALRQGAPTARLSEVAAELARALRASSDLPGAYAVARSELDRLIAQPGAAPRELDKLFSLVVELAIAAGEHDQAFRYLELSRSAELVGSVKLEELSVADPATEGLLKRLEELKRRMAALQAQGAESSEQSEVLRRVMASTRAEFFAQLDELKQSEPDFEALVQLSGADLSVLQKGLAEDEILLEYFPAEERLYLFAVTSTGFRLQDVSLGRRELTAAVGSFVTQVRNPESNLLSLRRRCQEMGALLVPEEMLKGRRRLRLVPTGALWEVPFECLIDSSGRTLDEQVEVSYLTSADLLRTLQGVETGGLAHPLLMGAPDSQDLPGAAGELEALSRILPNNVTLVGSRASGRTLREIGPRSDVLHLATHSGLGRGDGQAYLELADGPFTLEQIYGLALRPGALVVLSSCQSALGKESPQREVTSLASAFNIAGASTVIASHWEVDDQQTSRLFQSFYHHLLAGRNRGEALRLARRELAQTAPHPFYWAAFSLFGQPG